MKQSKIFMPTLREVPSEAEVISHKMLLRGGYIRQIASGYYSYLPLAFRVIKKIESIVREELEAIDANELLMPTVIPKELWEKNAPLGKDDEGWLTFKDSHDATFVLGPSHEEVLTNLIHHTVPSYKRYPVSLYQIQTKYRDEPRARAGLLKSKEFLLSEAYSFHLTKDSLEEGYRLFEKAYDTIFKRCGLNFRAVIGSNNQAPLLSNIDGKTFMALSEIGDQTIAYSSESDYASRTETANNQYEDNKSHEPLKVLEKFKIEESHRRKEIETVLKVPKEKMAICRLYRTESELVMVMFRATETFNEVKLRHYLMTDKLEPVEEGQVFSCKDSFLGPIGLPHNIRLIADEYVQNMSNMIVGGNEDHCYYKHVNVERDFELPEITDLRMVHEGDMSPDGLGELIITPGIEIGSISKIGTVISDQLGASILDELGEPNLMHLGSYRLGISRLLSTIVEQHADERGINWPKEIAPFDVHIIPVDRQEEAQWELAVEIEREMEERGVSVLLDDRDERVGIKFKDADLVGAPFRITVGKKAEDGIVEVKLKKTQDMLEIRREELYESLRILTS